MAFWEYCGRMKRCFPKEIDVFLAVMSAFHLFIIGYIKLFFSFVVPQRCKRIRLKDISGKVILITGAGSGIGKLMAAKFSKHSCTVILLDICRTSMLDTLKLMDENSRSFMYECDVSDRGQVYDVARQIKDEVGKVDILVNNAAIVNGQMLMEIPDERIQRTIEVNTLAHFWMLKAFLPDMMATNSGHIVSLASMAGLNGFPRLTDYCASKFAAVGLMESLQLELRSQHLEGIKLTLVCPSLVNTGLFEGTKPALTVFMETEYVVDQIIEAVLTEEEFLMLPKWLYLVILFKWTMPRRAVRRFYENSGLLDFMDTFKGRTEKEATVIHA